MQPLKNERHEAFCQMVALGSSHASAFVSAGYAKRGAHKNAARLMANEGISARIRWLVARAADRGAVTMDSLIADAQRCRDLGIWHGQINAAVLAVKELGILSGFRVERRETRHIDPATISDEELAAIIRAGAPIDVQAVTAEARARLEPPRDNGADDGAGLVSPKQNDATSAAYADSSEDGGSSKPRKRSAKRSNAKHVLPSEIPVDGPVAPGTIEKAIRGLRRGRATSAPRPDLDDISKG